MSEMIELERLSETLQVLRRSRYHLDLGIASVEADMAAIRRKREERLNAIHQATLTRGEEEGGYMERMEQAQDVEKSLESERERERNELFRAFFRNILELCEKT